MKPSIIVEVNDGGTTRYGLILQPSDRKRKVMFFDNRQEKWVDASDIHGTSEDLPKVAVEQIEQAILEGNHEAAHNLLYRRKKKLHDRL